MTDDEYRTHCLNLLEAFSAVLEKQAANTSEGDPLRELAGEFHRLASGGDLYSNGPELVGRLFASCPQLAPLFPRDLLWFIGGECLHFMPDTELEVFQALDEMRADSAARGDHFDYSAEKAKLLKLQ